MSLVEVVLLSLCLLAENDDVLAEHDAGHRVIEVGQR